MTIIESHLTINVSNLDRSIAFYESIGFTTKYVWPNRYAQLEAPGIILGLHYSQTTVSNSGNVSVGLRTNDIEAWKQGLSLRSISVSLREEEGGSFIHFHDPDGTQIYVIKSAW